jgi:hypothetical protein
VKQPQDLIAPVARTTVCCDVQAHGCVQVTAEQLAVLRRQPGPGVGTTLPANFLKHADDQSVAALAAVLQTIEQFQLGQTRFTDWGVVSAPCFLGRATLVHAWQRMQAEGAWGVSPHFIPHRTQHAVSGTISQALKIHGPNFGAGGGPSSALEALLAAAALLEGSQLPGVWVILSGWEPELIPDEQGNPTTPCVCKAVALVLRAAQPGWHGLRLRITPATATEASMAQGRPTLPTLGSLERYLTAAREMVSSVRLVWQFESGYLELGRNTAGVIGPPHGFRARSAQRSPSMAQQDGAGTENKR